jgi:uncharacterized membrane protein YdcZ (DUF606 family)
VKTIVALLLLVGLFTVGTAHALTLQWDRNVESDVKDYGVYACFVKGCAVVKSAATLQTFVGQSVVGSFPIWPLPPGIEGAVVVTARDTSLNESGLSVSVFFDAAAPSIPVNPVLK